MLFLSCYWGHTVNGDVDSCYDYKEVVYYSQMQNHECCLNFDILNPVKLI